jgi:predicted nucleic acid-binding protein
VKYTLDTNIFIDGFRSEDAQAEVLAFLKRALPFTYLSAVVMQELAAGARTTEAARDVQQGLFEPFERRCSRRHPPRKRIRAIRKLSLQLQQD